MLISRRGLIGAGAATTLVPAVQSAEALKPTPSEDIGPFYPIVTVLESQCDLTRVPGQSARAVGTPFELIMTVKTPTGAPVRSAMVMIWQASAAGVYGHPRDYVKKAADPGFLGHALMRTGRDGSVRIVSIRPGAYPDDDTRLRTPHLHFEVIGESSRLITQMYFPGEPLNAKDRLIENMTKAGKDPRSLLADQRTAPESFAWTAVLPTR